ncbi:hypothetical protein R75465_07749 [Paraburkholderia aspalathi]|uniref:hypothetical protein n=1 Tax=Paraburkholderia aspalathi TaxID=1324617 RepID=UPI001B13DE8D|nr:hypothetical protein [Paraburkholderia aspalathi]CAE6862654.1 hypothetical protein R75465_07749 [Paraburkholderia aspalathi]
MFKRTIVVLAGFALSLIPAAGGAQTIRQGGIPVDDVVGLTGIASTRAAALVIPQADPVPGGQVVSDGRTRVTRDGRLVKCDSTGQAYEVTINNMVIEDPIWKNGKPVKCRVDMFVKG